jgi:hypothetical protein
MANDALQTISSISEAELTTPTSTQRFPLGMEITTGQPFGTSTNVKVWKYVQSHGSLSQYGVYAIKPTYASSATKIKSAAAASLAVYIEYGVTPVAVTSGYYCWLQTLGDCTVLAEGSSATAGNTLNVINTKATATDSSGTTVSTATFAVANTSTSSTTCTATLLGNRVIVA